MARWLEAGVAVGGVPGEYVHGAPVTMLRRPLAGVGADMCRLAAGRDGEERAMSGAGLL